MVRHDNNLLSPESWQSLLLLIFGVKIQVRQLILVLVFHFLTLNDQADTGVTCVTQRLYSVLAL